MILGGDTAQVALECGLSSFSLADMDITSSLLALWRGESKPAVEDFANVIRGWFSDASALP